MIGRDQTSPRGTEFPVPRHHQQIGRNKDSPMCASKCITDHRRKSLCIVSALIVATLVLMGFVPPAFADTVVTDGRFTNVYVYPNPSQETWEQHLNNLPADQKPPDWKSFTRVSI